MTGVTEGLEDLHRIRVQRSLPFRVPLHREQEGRCLLYTSDLVGLEPLPGQGLEVRFAVKLRVQNPNDRAVNFNGMALDLDVNGQPLASGVSDQSGSVPRFGETVVSVPVSISAFSVMRQAWGVAGYQPGQEVPYRLRGKLADGLFGTRRFSDKMCIRDRPGALLR